MVQRLVGEEETVVLLTEEQEPLTGEGVTTVAVKEAVTVLLLVIDTMQVVPVVVVQPVKEEKV